ncbi:MAG: ABC transporter substrate-binding protein [Candidatus Eremiobacterota bacterium]
MRRFLAGCLILALFALVGCTRPAGNGGTTGGTPATTGGSATGSTPPPSSKGDPNGPDAYAEKAVDGDTIKIGVYLPITGQAATFGEGTKAGMELAADEVNARGGILGKKIDLIFEDTEGKPDKAAAAGQKLINQDNVLVVLGEVMSSNSLAVAPICQEAQVPMISPSSTNVLVTQKGDFIFRVCFLDDFQGQVMARYAIENLKAKKAAILIEKSSDYSVGLADSFKKTFTEKGGTIVAEEGFTNADTDFTSVLTKIKTSSPDVIFLPSYYNSVGLVATQASQLGMKVPFLGGDGWESPKLIELGKGALENCAFSTHFNVNATEGQVAEFVKAFRKKTGNDPDGLSALGYDDVLLMADAINRAGKLNRWAIRDAIAATRDFPGVTGSITINANRDADKPATIMVVKNNKLEFVTQMQPEAK